MSDGWQDRLLDFWFDLEPAQWFKKDEAFDRQLRENFHELWLRERELPVDRFLESPRATLAAVILFDQIPRNIFRGHADQFATDHLALQLAKAAVDRGDDDTLSIDERAFLYLPFEHSEVLADQQRSLLLFTALGNPLYLKFANEHLELIQRFGRFPHRNAALGRAPRADELAAGNADPF
ncbi:MAG: DUF924 family protein [Sphingomicrobium sp.]